MLIIEIAALYNGAHRNQTGNLQTIPEGWAVAPSNGELKNFPFGSFEVEEIDGIPYVKEGSWIPGTLPGPDIAALRSAKETEISNACHEAIVSGLDVTLTDGTVGHFSLEETDQINLTTAYNAVLTGAEGYPYHADGQLCKMYSAADILAIGDAATEYKLYHLTYCNHMLAWVRRTETPEELTSIVYGAELPEDLAANMTMVLGATSGE